MDGIKVGDAFFVFDANRRVYAKGGNGGPIYREHFRPVKITGETSRSWIIEPWGEKVPKSDPWRVLKTQENVDERVWEHDHRYKIVRGVERCSVDALRKITEIIGYNPEPSVSTRTPSSEV